MPSLSPSPPSPSPPPPPPRSDSLRLSAEDMVLVANGGLRTPSGMLAHFLAYPPHQLCIARSDYLRPPLSPARPQPRSSLSLRVDSCDEPPRPRVHHQPHSYSVHTLRRQARARSPISPIEPISPVDPSCDCLPTDPIPPPELFDF